MKQPPKSVRIRIEPALAEFLQWRALQYGTTVRNYLIELLNGMLEKDPKHNAKNGKLT